MVSTERKQTGSHSLQENGVTHCTFYGLWKSDCAIITLQILTIALAQVKLILRQHVLKYFERNKRLHRACFERDYCFEKHKCSCKMGSRRTLLSGTLVFLLTHYIIGRLDERQWIANHWSVGKSSKPLSTARFFQPYFPLLPKTYSLKEPLSKVRNMQDLPLKRNSGFTLWKTTP